MSFSGDIKKELARVMPEDSSQQLAELIAILNFQGRILTGSDKNVTIRIATENVDLAKKTLKLIRSHTGLQPQLQIFQRGKQKKSHLYQIQMERPEEVKELLRATGLLHTDEWQTHVEKDDLCRRAYLRGAFFCAGSVSDPGKSYHCEMICRNTQEAGYLISLMKVFEIEGRMTVRKNRDIVYIKESAAIVDLLNVIGAHQSLMQMENVRILKGMRGSANRQYNCDNANIKKMVKAAASQVEDIRYVDEVMGIERLDPPLQETARERLAHPDVSLQELGTLLHPPVGKSGVNHRLRKIAAIAEDLRNGRHG